MRTHTQTEPAAEPVDVTIPAKPEYVSIARLTAAAVAARKAFSYDEIEDLKIAVSEACNTLIAATSVPRRPITLRVVPRRTDLVIWIEAQGAKLDLDVNGSLDPSSHPLDDSKLGLFLMQCLVDEVDIRHSGGHGGVMLRLVKRRQEGLDAGSSSAQQD